MGTTHEHQPSTMSATIYQKYRPTTFAELIGQEPLKKAMIGALEKGTVGHAYLLSGPRGTGKTTTARILAKCVNCTALKNGEPCNECASCKLIATNTSLDIIEIDAASHTGVEHIREIRDNVRLAPQSLKTKVYIIDEVHMLSSGAFNALLKTLEEPPEHILFILATTEIHKIPPTIISRCQRFDLQTLSAKQLTERLRMIAKKEHISIDDEALALIVRYAKGHVRDAESTLDQIRVLKFDPITAENIREHLGLTSEQFVEQLVEHCQNGNTNDAFLLLRKLTDRGQNVDHAYEEFIEYIRRLLLLSIDAKLEDIALEAYTEKEREQYRTLASTLKPKALTRWLTVLLEMRKHQASSPIHELPFELAILDICESDGRQTDRTIPARAPDRPAPRTPNAPESVNDVKRENNENAQEREKIHAQMKPSSIPQAQANTPTTTPKEPDYINNLQRVSQATTTINAILNQWSRIIDGIKQESHPLGSCVETMKPERMEGNTVILRTNFSFHKEQLNSLTNRELVAKVLDSIFTEKLQMKAILGTDGSAQTVANAPARINNADSRTTHESSSSLEQTTKAQEGGVEPKQRPTSPNDAVKKSTPPTPLRSSTDQPDLVKTALELMGGEVVT